VIDRKRATAIAITVAGERAGRALATAGAAVSLFFAIVREGIEEEERERGGALGPSLCPVCRVSPSKLSPPHGLLCLRCSSRFAEQEPS
jgi:hypothetical protein